MRKSLYNLKGIASGIGEREGKKWNKMKVSYPKSRRGLGSLLPDMRKTPPNVGISKSFHPFPWVFGKYLWVPCGVQPQGSKMRERSYDSIYMC